MYIQIKKIKQSPTPRGQNTIVTHIGLYSDDGKRIKRVPHDEFVINTIINNKISVSSPEILNSIKGETT